MMKYLPVRCYKAQKQILKIACLLSQYTDRWPYAQTCRCTMTWLVTLSSVCLKSDKQRSLRLVFKIFVCNVVLYSLARNSFVFYLEILI